MKSRCIIKNEIPSGFFSQTIAYVATVIGKITFSIKEKSEETGESIKKKIDIGERLHELGATGRIIRILSQQLKQPVYNPDYSGLVANRIKGGKKKNTNKRFEYMNAAVGFYVLSKEYESIGKFYEIKIFKTGAIQIPGIINENVADATEAATYLANVIKEMLNLNSKPKIKKLKIVMSNYRFSIIKNPETRINIAKLKNIINQIVTKSSNSHNNNNDKEKKVILIHKGVFNISIATAYESMNNSILYVKFKLEFQDGLIKIITAFITINGKVNIQGYYNPKAVKFIQDYIKNTIYSNYCYIKQEEVNQTKWINEQIFKHFVREIIKSNYEKIFKKSQVSKKNKKSQV